MVKSLVMGDIATEPSYNLEAKSGQVSFASWWELNKDVLKGLTNEQQQENAEDAVGENEANRSTKRTHIACAVITVSLHSVKTALANFISNGEAMFVGTTPGRQPFAILFAKELFNIIIDEATTTWFDDHNNDQEKREFVFYLHDMFMLLLCGLARAAEDFNTATCLQLDTVQHAPKEDYEKATMNMADDIKEV